MTTGTEKFAPIVTALGTERFGAELMVTLQRLSGADMCSVFAIGTQPVPRVIVAESRVSEFSAFARIASLRYIQTYWRRDVAATAALGRAHRSVQVLRRPAHAIRDIDYQHECYSDGAILERLSLLHRGAPSIIASAYRMRASGRFEPEAVDRFSAAAPLLHAIIERHTTMTAVTRVSTTRWQDVADRLLAQESAALSLREAQVLGLIADGASHAEIASRTGLGASSVATYRKRGYAKLGLHGKSELRAYADRLGQPSRQ